MGRSFLLIFIDDLFNDRATLFELKRLLDNAFILQLDFDCLLEYLLRNMVVLSHSLQLLAEL